MSNEVQRTNELTIYAPTIYGEKNIAILDDNGKFVECVDEKQIIEQLIIEIEKGNLTLEQIPEIWREKVESEMVK